MSHNAAFKVMLARALYDSPVEPAWIFSDEAADILHDLWWHIAAHLEEPDRRPPEGLEISQIHELADHRVRVIRFPPPQRMAENYFAAIAYRAGRRGWFLRHGPTSLRYLALEYGVDLRDGSLGTVLGEWTSFGHINYGDGPEPTEEAFLVAIQPLLAAGPVGPMNG